MIPINKQAPEKREHHPHGLIRVHSMFYTIQGEGPYVGVPAVFIRLSGCNLQCPGCDTEYATGVYESPESITTRVRQLFGDSGRGPLGAPLVVITGGEPFRQDIVVLLYLLARAGYRTQVETNGTMEFYNPFADPLDFDIVVSPKAGKVHRSLWSRIIAYKYVLNHGDIDERDGLPTRVLGMPGRPARPHEGFEGRVYVQPAEESEPAKNWAGEFVLDNAKNKVNLVMAIESAMRFGYTLCIQTHKIAGLE